MSQAVLIVEDVAKRVSTGDETLTILESVNLSVNAGETLAIVGHSGAGKSTLLSLLAGLDSPSSGEVFLLGQGLAGFSEDQRAALRQGQVGFIFQSFQLMESLTALENVMLPMELAGMKNPESSARDLLEKVGLQHRLNHFPRQLSGGEQQRVAIARAFSITPRILFADEPTGNLDDGTSDHISQLMFDLNAAQGTTLILVTHDVELAARCQRVVALKDGQLQPWEKETADE